MSIIRVNINNREFTAHKGSTILDIALNNGIDIPNLCHDTRMKPYGACGICVVEIDGFPKLSRACSTIASDGMIIKTDTPRTIAARKTALRLLASDHRGDCRPQCVNACPGHTDCQGYVGLVANGQYEEAIKLVKDVIPLPASIGRVCPHPCETQCRRGKVEEPIAIADIKRFLGDMDIKNGTYFPEVKKQTGKTIAVVGSGPAGISAAYFLAMRGHKVVIFEDQPYPGGMLRYGIPQYRLPKEILDAEIDTLRKMGVEIKCNVKLGEDISIAYLRKTYDSVFIAIGAWDSSKLGCTGQDMEGIMGGIEFLKKATLAEPIYLGEKVVVIGGGNTAMDVARTAVRLGAESVKVLYRRTREEMPAEKIEIEEAEEEGVSFHYLVAPVEIVGDGKRAKGIRCQRMKLGEADKSGRRTPVPMLGEEITFDADLIVSAIGQKVNAENVKELETTNRGNISANPFTFETSVTGVFAGGEAVTGPKIAIEAIAQGKNAAQVIDGYLNGLIVPVANPSYIVQDDITKSDFKHIERQSREQQIVMEPAKRKLSFSPISETFSTDKAVNEANRCLECGCHDYFECKLIKYIGKYNIDTEALSGEKHRREEMNSHPFIVRNPDKCILCGLCYRACDEIMGVTALGLEARGFDTKVIPEFNLPLEESICISCGQCVDVCPTGACMEREAVKKQVPVAFNNVNSVCNYCGAGCNMVLQTKGDLVFKALPDKSRDEGLLCARGRFGISHINDENRIIKPIIRGKESCLEVELEEAIALIAKKLQLITGRYGKDSVAIFASPRFTNEEAFIIKKISDKLNTEFVGTMSEGDVAGTESVLGYNASSNSYEELYSADLIISIGNVAENQPIMGIKIKMASSQGAKLISISNKPTRMEEWADKSISIGNDFGFLKGMIKGLIDLGYVNRRDIESITKNYDELLRYVETEKVSEEVLNIARMYGESKKPIIVIDDYTVTTDAFRLVADMAVISGKIGKPHRGIIIVRSKSNTQGFIDLGLKSPGKLMMDSIVKGRVKAAVIIGEDIAAVDKEAQTYLRKLDFLADFDMFMTDTAEISNVVVPISSFAESEGTLTRSDRKIQRINAAVKPLNGKSTFDILLRLAQYLGVNIKDMNHTLEMISFEVPAYSGHYIASIKGEEIYTPNTRDNINGEQVLYTQGFNKEDKKAHLAVPLGERMFKEKKIYDTIQMRFEEILK